jgi:hypothetical protein
VHAVKLTTHLSLLSVNREFSCELIKSKWEDAFSKSNKTRRLANVRNKEDQLRIQNLSCVQTQSAWLGGYNAGSGHVWLPDANLNVTVISGLDVNASTYLNWGSDFDSTKNCTSMTYSSKNFTWEAIDCTNKLASVWEDDLRACF